MKHWSILIFRNCTLCPVKKGRSTLSLRSSLKKAFKTGDSSEKRLITINPIVNRLALHVL
nr:MAG TPA: hypothetical protein [Caudoviricetes sp.]DAO90558.1 MAG TPA: hypothetical protein [Caudoviricetes sp.]DAR38631.1 MAG TPA: hypothetical protein [Caudoviricetes sp.]